MLHNTFGGNKKRHDDVRYKNANFHGNKQMFKAIKQHLKGHLINRILQEWSFHIKFIKLSKGLFNKLYMNDHSWKILGKKNVSFSECHVLK